jgi:hypothetical protein
MTAAVMAKAMETAIATETATVTVIAMMPMPATVH